MRAIIFVITLVASALLFRVEAEKCAPNKFAYGENTIIDQLMICSLSKSFDLDLTPRGELVKSTARALVDQGLSEKTSILYAKLSGLWTVRRPKFVESGWKCDEKKTTVSSVIEMSGLSLDVVEKVDIPVNRNQQKLVTHKPCRTFDLPFWMCRQSKPIYKTIKTWVNRAYFNLTLSQFAGRNKPHIEKLSLIFTCPEHFKQKITHSPSAMHLLTKHIPSSPSSQPPSAHLASTSRSFEVRKPTNSQHKQQSLPPPLILQTSEQLTGGSQRAAYTSTQDGKGPVLPPYHNSVNAILQQVENLLETSIKECIRTVDSDLSLMTDHSSFSRERFSDYEDRVSGESDYGNDHDDDHDKPFKFGSHGLHNECSSRLWLKNRLNISEQAIGLEKLEGQMQNMPIQKRSQIYSGAYHPSEDPNELLDPNGHYQSATSSEPMIDDNHSN